MYYPGIIKSLAVRISVVTATVFAILAIFSVVSTAAQSNARMGETTFVSGSVGLIHGQTMRVGIVNPVLLDGSVRMFGGHVKVFDLRGNAVANIPQPRIRPGEFHTVDINRSDLSHVGDPRTGRLQLRLEVFLVHSDVGQGTGDDAGNRAFPPSFELVNAETGESILIGMLLPAIQK